MLSDNDTNSTGPRKRVVKKKGRARKARKKRVVRKKKR